MNVCLLTMGLLPDTWNCGLCTRRESRSGTFSPPPTSKEAASKRPRHASRHVRHARALMHVGIADPQWREKRSLNSRPMHNPQFYVSGKRVTKLDESICYCWCPIVMKWSLWLQQVVAIVMSYTEISKAGSQWLLTINRCISVTWPFTCAFHIPCTHASKIIDMHRGMCDETI